jgi:hypothetical protein
MLHQRHLYRIFKEIHKEVKFERKEYKEKEISKFRNFNHRRN